MSEEIQNHPTFKKRSELSISRVVKIVFPSVTNNHDTLFGGKALAWMDEIASISAMRFSRQQVVTISLDRINFKKPIPSGHFVELVAQVVDVGRTSMKILVEVFLEEMQRDFREKAITGMFTFVAIDAERKPIPVAWDQPVDDIEFSP